jgi:hypothetical protein
MYNLPSGSSVTFAVTHLCKSFYIKLTLNQQHNYDGHVIISITFILAIFQKTGIFRVKYFWTGTNINFNLPNYL